MLILKACGLNYVDLITDEGLDRNIFCEHLLLVFKAEPLLFPKCLDCYILALSLNYFWNYKIVCGLIFLKKTISSKDWEIFSTQNDDFCPKDKTKFIFSFIP